MNTLFLKEKSMIENQYQQNRNFIHMEFLRIIAIYLVMFNHTRTKGFFLFSVSQSSPLYGGYLFISIADKIAVPIFFMISGALLLDKHESIRIVYKKRVLRMLIILVVISFCYHIYDWYYHSATFNMHNFFVTIYSKNASIQLWYLYSYIGVLMMLPLLRKMVKNLEEKDYIYLFFCHMVFVGVIPIVNYIISNGRVTLNENFSIPLLTANNIFYFVMGYYFEHVLKESKYKLKNVIIAISLSIVAIGISCYMTNYRALITGNYDESVSQYFHNSLISIPTFTTYFSVKYWFIKKELSSKIKNIVKLFGSTVFGIYLLERMLRERTEEVFYILNPVIKTLPACLIWIGVCFIIGFIITYIFKKIPMLGKYI